MNYYEQFYDDLELMDYDEANARYEHEERRQNLDHTQWDNPYYEQDYYRGPFLEEKDPFLDRSHRGLPDGGERGQGQFQGSRGQRGNYFERGRGRGKGDYNDRDRGGYPRGRGGAERGRAGPSRGRSQRGGNRGKFGMNFVKASTASVEAKEQDKKAENSYQTSTSNANSGTIRFDYKAFLNEPSEIEKEVEQGLKAYRVQLGYGYGYGPRSDLIDGDPDAAWMAMGEKPTGNTPETQLGPTSECYSYNTPEVAMGNCEEVANVAGEMPTPAVTPVPEKQKPTATGKTGVAKPGWNFVKAKSEFRSTDVAFHETDVNTQPVPNTVSVNMGNKRVGLGFGVSPKTVAGSSCVVYEKFHGGLKDGRNPSFDAKFAKLHEAVKLKNLPNKNGIEVMHMAIDRVKMSMVDDVRPGGRTSTGQPMFLCRLEVDGVHVADGLSTTKKGAKHDAFKNGMELLLKENLTVKEAPGGGLELKVREPEAVAGTFLIPPTPVLQCVPPAANKGVTKPGQGPSGGKTQLATKPSVTGNRAGEKPSQCTTTAGGKSADVYVKPKIVFHNPQTSSDSPLEFRTPGKTSPSHCAQSLHSAELMAQSLLNFVKNESAELNKVNKDIVEVNIEINNQSQSDRKTVVKTTDVSEPTRNEKSEAVVASTCVWLSSPSVAKPAVDNKSKADVTCTSVESSLSSVVKPSVSNKYEAVVVSTSVESGSLLVSTSSASSHTTSCVSESAITTASRGITCPPYIPRQTFVKSSNAQKEDNSKCSLIVPDSVESKLQSGAVKPQSDTKACYDIKEQNKSTTFTKQAFVKSSSSLDHETFSDTKEQNISTQFMKQTFVKSSDTLDHEKGESSSSSIAQSAPPQPLSMFKPPTNSGRLQSIVCVVNQTPQNNPRKRVNDTPVTPVHSKLKSRKVNKMNDLDDLSQFIIIDSSDVSGCQTMTDLSILHNSANMNKVVMKVEYEACVNGFSCSFVISDHLIGTTFGINKEEAKVNAAKSTLDELRQMCYTIKVKQNVDSDESGLTKDQLMSDNQRSNERLPDSNVGNMLLRKMGWKGGGVGKDGQGRAEPVKAEMVIGRAGLGLTASRGIGKEFNKIVTKMLEDYVKSDEQKDLHFSSELSKEERAVVHNIGQKMGLKTQSKGKDNNRYLIISRKRTAQELLEHVMRNGGSTSKYLVIPPASGTNEFWCGEDVAFGHGKQ